MYLFVTVCFFRCFLKVNNETINMDQLFVHLCALLIEQRWRYKCILSSLCIYVSCALSSNIWRKYCCVHVVRILIYEDLWPFGFSQNLPEYIIIFAEYYNIMAKLDLLLFRFLCFHGF